MVARAHAGKSTAAYNERGINIIDVRMEARNPVTREWRHCSHGKELEWMCRTVSREKDWPTKCAPTREKNVPLKIAARLEFVGLELV
jgi:hypothetical protein